MLEKLDLLRYTRNGEEIEKLISSSSGSNDISEKLKLALEKEINLYKTFSQSKNNLHKVQDNIKTFITNLNFEQSEIAGDDIDSLFLPIFASELLDKIDIKYKFLDHLQNFFALGRNNFWEELKNQPYRLRSYVEIYLTKFLNESKAEDNSISIQNFEALLNVILKYMISNKQPKDKYPTFEKSDKVIFFTCLWKLLNLIDKECIGLDKFKKKISSVLDFCRNIYKSQISEHNKIILLYTLNVTVIPMLDLKDLPEFNKISPVEFKEFMDFMAPSNSFKSSSLPNSPTWKQFVLTNFCILHQLIQKRTELTYKLEGGAKETISLDDINEIISPFCTVNLNVYRNALKALSKEIIDSKALVLFTNFLMKYQMNGFAKELLERNLVNPFDDSFLIKNLITLLQIRDGEHIKAYQLLQQLLEKDKPKDQNQSTLNFLCSLVCLKYLDKPEEALMLTKNTVNVLDKHEAHKVSVPRHVIYLIAGYCYQRMGDKNPFFKQKLDLWAKSIEYFEKSYQINKYDPNTLFSLALMHSQILNLDEAAKFTKEAYQALNI